MEIALSEMHNSADNEQACREQVSWLVYSYMSVKQHRANFSVFVSQTATFAAG